MAKSKVKPAGPKSRASAKVAVFYGNMDWFDVDSEEAPRSMPAEFKEAVKLHKSGATKNAERIVSLLQPFAHAVFIPPSLPGWKKHFESLSGDDFFEIPAAWVRLCGVDFDGGGGPFPLARMEAEFEVPVKASFDHAKFRQWVEKNDVSLFDAVSFMWRLSAGKSSRDHELFTWQNNQGAECVLTKRSKAVRPKD